MDFRSIVTTELKRRKISAYRLAIKTGISKSTVNEWLAGKHDLLTGKLEKMLEYLKIEISPDKGGK